jgi:hypothetical protein
MIRRLDDVGGGVLAYEASGTITRDDVRVVQDDLLAGQAPARGRRMFVDVVGVDGATLHAVWQDVKHTLDYARYVDRVAVVGDERWHEWVTQAARLVPGIDMRYFEPDQRIEAGSWLGAG